MGKFWKNNKAVISGTLIAVLAIGGFIGLGYYYSSSNVGYDYVGVGPQVDSINYNTGTGNQYRITTITNEGLLTPTTDFKTLQNSITVALNDATEDLEGNAFTTPGFKNAITDNDLVSIEEYEMASKYVLVDYAKDYKDSKDLFNTLNDNEKTIVILASDAINNAGEVDVDSENLENATRILSHARPVTYIGDDVSEAAYIDPSSTEYLKAPEWDPNSSYMISAYAYGVADAIYTNPKFTTFRFRLRDGSLDDGVSTWETWNDNGEKRNDRVSAADVAFGMSRQIPAMYGSSSRYMYTSIAKLKGSDEAAAADKNYGITDVGRYYVDNGVDGERDLNSVSTDDWRDLDAIYYGLAPDKEEPDYSRENTIFKDVEIQNFDGTPGDSGITYHDPEGYEDKAVELGSDDYSYIEFNTYDGFDTFPTMMASTGFWPINWEWFVKTIGRPGFDELNEFGTSADTILSNGAQRVTEFDNLYGYTTVKNESYYDKDLVTAEKTSFRMVAEASTQVAMFENGDATYVLGSDANTKSIMDSEEAYSWLPEKFTKPANKFMFFNLGTDRLKTRSETAKFTSDPNFRRAFTYAFDTNVYHELNSTDTAYAVSTFEPAGMYTDASGNDLVDYMTDTTFTNQGNDVLGSDEQLEYFDYNARKEAVVNGVDLSSDDPTKSYELADYYFQVFLDDMSELGVDVPKTITLKYLTSVGPNDPFIKTIQQQISTHKFLGEYTIELEIEQVAAGTFFGYYYAGDYDLASIQWSGDYLDSWANIGIFNLSENSRGGNSTGGWNFWDGSDYTFDDSTYDDPEKARELFNDGFAQFYEGDNANLTSLEFVANPDRYDGTTVFDTYTSTQFESVADQLWTAALGDNGISSWTPGTAVADTNAEDSTSGINYNKHTEDIWSKADLKLASNILFETILKDGSATITGTTESRSISPSRALLEGDPIIGYEARTFSFDVTKAKGFWRDVNRELQDEFYK